MSERSMSQGTLTAALSEPARGARPVVRSVAGVEADQASTGIEAEGGDNAEEGPEGPERAGWLVGDRAARGTLRLVDCSPVAKFEVRADPAGPLAARLAVAVGQLELFEEGILAASPAPGEWLLFVPGAAGALEDLLKAAAKRELVTVVDLTHGRALLRLSGECAAELLSHVCELDLSDAAFATGRVATAPVAGTRALVLRDDLFYDEAGLGELDADVVDAEVPSYLLCVERSVTVWLGERLADLGGPLGLEEEGYLRYRRRRPEV